MNIVVLAGGTSTERDVSLSSGKKIYDALKEKNQKVVLIDVYLGYEGPIDHIFDLDTDWVENISEIKENNPDVDEIKQIRSGNPNIYFGPNVIAVCQKSDIVFLALHGENGENGKIQAAFDLLGIKYTGTDYISAALAMDKSLSKELFDYNHIPNPKSIILRKGMEDNLPHCYPKVVKVVCGGSSIGVFIVHNIEEYKQALFEAFRFEREILVEEYIEGREFSVGILEGKALPVIEIIPKQGFYDYKNKYQTGNTVEVCPAQLSEEKAREMKDTAEKVFRILRMKTYARIDFMMSKENDAIYCLEANTLPGMTPNSLIPQEAAVIGISYPDLCLKIIEISLRKYES